MNQQAVIETIVEHFSSLFPMPCPSCQQEFESYEVFLQRMKPLGAPISYDAELGGWGNDEYLGTAVLFNCQCKTTLSLGFETMDPDTYRQILGWIRHEIEQEGRSLKDVLSQLQREIGAAPTP